MLTTATGDAELVQTVNVYADASEADRAFGLLTKEASCSTGHLPDGTAITISAAVDVTADVGPGEGRSTAWQFRSNGVDGVLIATVAGRLAQSCLFVKSPRVPDSAMPNPVTVAQRAVQKLATH